MKKVRRTTEDRRTSLAVRERDGFMCRRCGGAHARNSTGLHAAHIFTRSRKATRHDLDNLVALCYGCHSYFHQHPLEFIQWAEDQLGTEKFEALRKRSQTLVKG